MPPPKMRLHFKKAEDAIDRAVLSAQKARHLLYKAGNSGHPEHIEIARQHWQNALYQLQHIHKKYHAYMSAQQRIDLKLVHEMLEHHGYQVLT